MKEESKHESIIWDVQVNNTNGFFPVKKYFDNIVKPDNLKINKENSLTFLPNNLSSVVSLQQIPNKKEISKPIKIIENE